MFMYLQPTIGQPEDFTDFTWYEVDLGEMFGLTELTS